MLPSTAATMTAILTAVVCGALAAALTGWIRSIADSDSRWLRSGLHVGLAAAGGAGAAGLAGTVPELVAFAALAVACGVLVAIDLAVHRLPDVVVVPMYPVLLATLGVASAVTGDWGALGRAAAAALALLALYFTLAFINPSGLGLGDVKLAGVLGLFLGWLGWYYVLVGTLAAFAINAVVALVLLASRRANRHTGIAFGPAMIAGAAVAAWLSVAG
ncbi:peptidase A24 [Dietzia sp. UCD-THP]|uniref:prepilin peptidase n=1 Tax=Dietzia sp. UCD-THP TaxID=1292020 RepID=UPI0003645E3C|nr:A24 family peptidase [Dietzia sp. UCD-THP]EYT57651.1 peptidase A24 [Dietzia sp. UCD-THP]